MNDSRPSQVDLQATARQIMLEHGFEPDFRRAVPQQLAGLKANPPQSRSRAGTCATCASCSGHPSTTTPRVTSTRLKPQSV